MLAGAAAAGACRRGLLRVSASPSSGAAAGAAAAAAATAAARQGPAPLPLLLLRGLSTAAPPKQQRKGKTPPTRNPARISAPTLEGKPPAIILELLQQKCEGANRPRLSDLHTLLEAARRSHGASNDNTGGTAAVLGGVELFVKKNVEFREETAALFLRAMCRAGGLGEAVDALLDRGKRLGIWAPRKTLHMALHKLGQEKDAERLLKLYGAMEAELGVARTARSVHLAVRGLVGAGAVAEAEQVASEAAAAGMVLADSTKEILSGAKAAAAKKEEGKKEEGKKEEGEGAAAAAAPAAAEEGKK